VATTGFLKASIAVQLLNLTDKRRHRVAIQTVLGVSVVYTAAFFFILLFECSPVDHFWMGILGGQGACMTPKMIGALTITHSILNIAADVSKSQSVPKVDALHEWITLAVEPKSLRLGSPNITHENITNH